MHFCIFKGREGEGSEVAKRKEGTESITNNLLARAETKKKKKKKKKKKASNTMTAQEIVLLLSVSIGSLILGACTARKELLEGVYSHWRAVILCIVSDSAEETLPPRMKFGPLALRPDTDDQGYIPQGQD